MIPEEELKPYKSVHTGKPKMSFIVRFDEHFEEVLRFYKEYSLKSIGVQFPNEEKPRRMTPSIFFYAVPESSMQTLIDKFIELKIENPFYTETDPENPFVIGFFVKVLVKSRESKDLRSVAKQSLDLVDNIRTLNCKIVEMLDTADSLEFENEFFKIVISPPANAVLEKIISDDVGSNSDEYPLEHLKEPETLDLKN